MRLSLDVQVERLQIQLHACNTSVGTDRICKSIRVGPRLRFAQGMELFQISIPIESTVEYWNHQRLGVHIPIDLC